jgi:hypothetical protein
MDDVKLKCPDVVRTGDFSRSKDREIGERG